MLNLHDIQLTSSFCGKTLYINRQGWPVRFSFLVYVSQILLGMFYHFGLEVFSTMDTNGCLIYANELNVAFYIELSVPPRCTHNSAQTFIYSIDYHHNCY
jgi:hypothetical protein